MLTIDTFLVTVYVLVDDFCQSQPEPRHPGPVAALSRAEAVTLCLFGQWSRFQSERDFYRFCDQRLRHLFPRLPDRSQFNRQLRKHYTVYCAFLSHLAQHLGAEEASYEVVDRCAFATRDRRRRGEGWLFSHTDIGLSNRLGFFEGFHILDCATKDGIVTGFCLAPASAKDQPMATAFFAARHTSDSRFPCVGEGSLCQDYLGDKGFSGPRLHRRWKEAFCVSFHCVPQHNHAKPWPKPWRLWMARHRQIIETVHDKILNTFRLAKERPHHLYGALCRLAAKYALHNLCIYINRQLGRPNLAFADLLGWN